MAAAAMEQVRGLESLVDLIQEQLREPCKGEEQKTMVEDLVREGEDQRKKLEELAMSVIDQEGGDKAFNSITLVMDRLERVTDQKNRWASAAPAAGAAAAPVPASSPAVSPAAAGFGGGSGEDFGVAAHHSPMPSYAASSEAAFDAASRRSDGRKEKKKDKKDKKSKGSAPSEDFSFQPNPAAATAPEIAGASSGFGWPSQEGEAPGGSAWGSAGPPVWSAPAIGADGAAAADGGFGGWGAGGGAVGSDAAAFPDGGGWGTSDEPHATAAGASSFGVFAEEPGGFGAAHAGPAAVASGLEPFGAASLHPSAWHEDASGALGGACDGGLGSPAGPPHQATLHIRCPFDEVEHDRIAFERLFIREVSQAVGVAPHRIKVRAVRRAQ